MGSRACLPLTSWASVLCPPLLPAPSLPGLSRGSQLQLQSPASLMLLPISQMEKIKLQKAMQLAEVHRDRATLTPESELLITASCLASALFTGVQKLPRFIWGRNRRTDKYWLQGHVYYTWILAGLFCLFCRVK